MELKSPGSNAPMTSGVLEQRISKVLETNEVYIDNPDMSSQEIEVQYLDWSAARELKNSKKKAVSKAKKHKFMFSYLEEQLEKLEKENEELKKENKALKAKRIEGIKYFLRNEKMLRDYGFITNLFQTAAAENMKKTNTKENKI